MKCKKATALITLCLVIFTLYCFTYGISDIGAHDSSSSTRIGVNVGNSTLENLTSEIELSQEIQVTDNALESAVIQEKSSINYPFLGAWILMLAICIIALYVNMTSRPRKYAA